MTDPFTRRAFSRQLIRTLFIPFLMLVLCPFIGYLVASHLANVVRWDRHSIEVLAKANDLEKSFTDLETGVRGFQLTGDPAFLEPYAAANPKLSPQFAQLQYAVSDNPDQTHRLELVLRDFEGWKVFATEAIDRVRRGVPRDREFYGLGKTLMDRTRADMTAFLAAENLLLDERSRSVGPAKQTAVFARRVVCRDGGGDWRVDLAADAPPGRHLPGGARGDRTRKGTISRDAREHWGRRGRD